MARATSLISPHAAPGASPRIAPGAARKRSAALLGVVCAALLSASVSAEALRPPSQLSAPSAPGSIMKPGTVAVPGIVVKPIAVRADEFPPIGPGQVKAGFECTIRMTAVQTDYQRFPRYRCDLDREQTAKSNRFSLARVGVYPSADGITTKIVVIVEKPEKAEKGVQSALSRQQSLQIRGAFQLYRDTSDKQSAAVLPDFVYADGIAPSF